VGAKFCLECGQAVGGPTAGQDRFSSPESYTPKHLAEKILTSKNALEGERKQVTVLFADLKGSMELLAERDPEEARKILDPVLERMTEAVHRYEGTVNQVMGDGIMALFGAPIAHEDHAVRACYAALRMQESVKKYAEDVRRSHAAVVKIRVGLNSGEVVVRAIGSDLRMDYTAVGQTTHLAARMEQLAEPGTALLTPATLALCEDFVQVKSLGPMGVKGLAEPLEAYELTGANPVRSRFRAHASRGLTKFVGRTSEIAQLGDALDLARRGRGQVVAVVGEPGVGKSRLFWEFTHSHSTAGCLILEAASVSYGKATTYLPVIELLRGYFQIEPRDDVREIREKVTGKLLSLDRALEAVLPAVLAILDVPVEDDQWTSLDPPQRRQRTLDAVKHLLLRESQAQPLVVAFENLHWIDGETQAVLDGLVESLPTARLLLLVNYRPEYRHGWGSKTYYRQVQLDALPAASAEDLLEALLGNDPTLVPLKRLLTERTEGNPFFLEESVRTLVETLALDGAPGAYRATRALGGLQMPATAQAIVAARLDRLDTEDKRLLQAASVIGKDVSLVLLEAVRDRPESELRRSLARLQAAEFLYETRLFPEVEYTFKHALTHEVTYGGLLRERRRELHAQIVHAIESLHRDRLGEQIERLAHHAVRAEDWERAVTYLRRAGAKAFDRSAHREAVGYFEQSSAALAHLPESRETLERAIDIRFELRNSLQPLGEVGRYIGYLREAETIAARLPDQHRVAWVAAYTTAALYLIGDSDGALASGERALQLAEPLRDISLHVSTRTWLGQVYYRRADYHRAVECFRRNTEDLIGNTIRERFGFPQLPSVHTRTCLVACLAELGEFAEAVRRGEEGLGIAESVDHPLSVCVACVGIGSVHLWKGDLRVAIPLLERAIALIDIWNIRLWLPRVASVLGYAYALSERLTDAIRLLEKAVDEAKGMGLMGGYSQFVGYLGEAHLLNGRVEEAVALAGQALQIARQYRERGEEARALRLLGEAATHRGQHQGVDHFHQALELATELSMRPLVAHCHLGLGKLYRRTGEQDQAREHLTIATTMYREMGMTYWLEQATQQFETT
jgi:class 3 adenylate cyclase/tetratricopeptide (TPR) repeat protein